MKRKLKIATLFSGIGAVEESLKQLDIDSKIVFASDNGERSPSLKEDLLLEVAAEIFNENEQKSFIKDLTKACKERTGITDDVVNIGVSEYDISDLRLALLNFSDSKRELFVSKWYETTGKPNFMREAYFANYSIENSSWYEDVRFINGSRYHGKVDLMVGGSPCQSFSTFGKKRGLEDTRGTLFYDYARLISETSPKVFIYENVKGLLTHDKKRTWKIMKEVFESLDYNISYQVLNAKDYGLPQLRNRIFVIGIRSDISKLRDKYVFPQPIQLTKKSTDYLGQEVDDRYYLGKKGFEWMTNVSKNGRRSRVNQDVIGCQTAYQQDNWIGDFRMEKPKPHHHEHDRIHVGKFNGQDAVIRKMTGIECLRLMGFKHFKPIHKDKQVYRHAGNSIAVPVMNALIKSLLPYLNEE